jgi:microcystin-dependent protein
MSADGWWLKVPLRRAAARVAASGNGLSQRNLGDLVGEESHMLTVAELPSHSHVQGDQDRFTQTVGGLAATGILPTYRIGNSADGDANAQPVTQPAGGGAAHSVMQPSIALLYCEKS